MRIISTISFSLLLSLLLSTPAFAQDESPAAPPSDEDTSVQLDVAPSESGRWFWLRQQVAVAGWPTGLISDTRLEFRTALHRTDGMVFNDTYAGIGARVRITPAFVEGAARFSFAPIDVFDVDFHAGVVGYWPSSSGLLPYASTAESSRDLDREDRHKVASTAAPAGKAFYLSAVPTLKLKVGPVIVFDSLTIAQYWIDKPEGETRDFVYEPFWDRIMAHNDTLIQNELGLLFEIADGKAKPHFLVGAMLRSRTTRVSKDSSVALGGVVILKPGVKPGVPRILVQVMPYVKDADRIGGAPNVALALVWNPEFKLGQALKSN